jgi:tetratricopeptide (TPR) repeat protein
MYICFSGLFACERRRKVIKLHDIKMKHKSIGLSILVGLIALVTFSSICFGMTKNFTRSSTSETDASEPFQYFQRAFPIGLDSSQSCTIIYASDGKIALAGNNEDANRFDSYIWFLPAEKGKFGRIYFGWRIKNVRYPQGGMNDKGLFFDGATAENVKVPRDPSKLPYEGNLILKAMEECSTVEEVLKLYDRYDVSGNLGGQYLIGDRFGNSAIIEPQTVIRKKGKYQIATNFFQSKTKPENSTCERYHIAEELFEKSDNISVDLFRRILNATHQEVCSQWMTSTIYSYICDLKKGEIYIYNFHNFEDVVKINLQEELTKGERFHPILSLFPYETFAAKQYKSERIIGMLYERAVQNGVEGSEGTIALYDKMKTGDYKIFKLDVGEGQLNALGYRLLENNKLKEAIEIFKFVVLQYPESYNAYDSFGEAFMKAGEKDLAIRNYEKSLELNPKNENAKKKLEELRKK